MKPTRLNCIIISTQDYKEADRLVTFFSVESGKQTAIAKGVRKLSSRKRGSLELLNQVELNIVGRGNLQVITETKTLQNYDLIKSNLRKVAVAYFYCEVVKKITAELQPNEEIFFLLKNSLSELNSGSPSKTLKERFTKKILMFSGFMDVDDKTDPLKTLYTVLEKNLGSVRIGKMLQ